MKGLQSDHRDFECLSALRGGESFTHTDILLAYYPLITLWTWYATAFDGACVSALFWRSFSFNSTI